MASYPQLPTLCVRMAHTALRRSSAVRPCPPFEKNRRQVGRPAHGGYFYRAESFKVGWCRDGSRAIDGNPRQSAGVTATFPLGSLGIRAASFAAGFAAKGERDGNGTVAAKGKRQPLGVGVWCRVASPLTCGNGTAHAGKREVLRQTLRHPLRHAIKMNGSGTPIYMV